MTNLYCKIEHNGLKIWKINKVLKCQHRWVVSFFTIYFDMCFHKVYSHIWYFLLFRSFNTFLYIFIILKVFQCVFLRGSIKKWHKTIKKDKKKYRQSMIMINWITLNYESSKNRIFFHSIFLMKRSLEYLFCYRFFIHSCIILLHSFITIILYGLYIWRRYSKKRWCCLDNTYIWDINVYSIFIYILK